VTLNVTVRIRLPALLSAAQQAYEIASNPPH
jgi:hypothetical protein